MSGLPLHVPVAGVPSGAVSCTQLPRSVSTNRTAAWSQNALYHCSYAGSPVTAASVAAAPIASAATQCSRSATTGVPSWSTV